MKVTALKPYRPASVSSAWHKPSSGNVQNVQIAHDKFTRLYFGSEPIEIDGHDTASLEIIKNLLTQCSYRKSLKKVMAIGNDFSVSMEGGKPVLNNYHQTPDSAPFEGECMELAEGLQSQLKEVLGDVYNFRIVRVTEPQFFSTENAKHFCILALRRDSKNGTLDELIQKSLDEGHDFPPNCLIIDPSFKILASTNTTHGYRLIGLPKDSPEVELSSETPSIFYPLGFSYDILRCPAVGFNNALLYWGLMQYPDDAPSESAGKVDICYALQNPGGPLLAVNNWIDLIKAQGWMHPLTGFTSRVRRGLGINQGIY